MIAILLYLRRRAILPGARRKGGFYLYLGGITANLTNIVDFRGFDSSTILISRGGIPRPIGIS